MIESDTGAPSSRMLAGGWLMKAEDGFEQLGASRADEAEESDDFTRGDGQADVAKCGATREVADRQA